MNDKSRVVRYADLRKKISNMDVYSFEDSETTRKNLPPTTMNHAYGSLENDNPQVTDQNGIKRNTLSLSIDELIKEHDTYDSEAQRKEAKERYHRKKREERSRTRHGFSLKALAWVLIVLTTLALVVLILLVITGVL